MSLPQYHTIVAAKARGELIIKSDAPIPALEPDMVLVKTAAVAINPHDAKTLEYSTIPGAIVGSDFSGAVAALGSDVKASGRFAIGDRVAGTVLGMNKMRPDIGAFAEYVNAMSDFLLKIPDSLSFEEASTLPLGAATALFALFNEMELPVSLDELGAHESRPATQVGGEIVLVAGGSTATGTRAIQLLKLYVLTVLCNLDESC